MFRQIPLWEISYRTNSTDSANAPVGAITNIVDGTLRFTNVFNLDSAKVNDVRNSLEVINEVAIVGDTDFIDSDNIKTRAVGAFHSQNRAVTTQDYKTLCYSMDPKYGSIKRCSLVVDQDSFKRNLNLYIISEDAGGNFISSNKSIKDNLKTWLNNYKMISDTIDILDARVINLGIDFSVTSELNSNKGEVLQRCISALKENFRISADIGEPFYITKIYSVLNNVDGVVDTSKVEIKRISGNNYSTTYYNIKDNRSADGKYILIPKNVIYEIKYPNDDIRGVVK